MNKRLMIVGSICLSLWGFVTVMSKGMPLWICRLIDRLTFHQASEEIFKMANGFYYDVNNNDMPTVMFLCIYSIIFCLFFYLIRQIDKRPSEDRSVGLVILFSILFRLILLPGELIHENDIYRYLWDGKSSVHRINPYKYAPADLFMYEQGHSEDYYDDYWEVTIKAREITEKDKRRLDKLIELRDQNPVFYKRIGHWQVPTIYPPVAEFVFFISAKLKQDSILVMKSIFALFDIGVIMLVVALLKHFNLNPVLSLIYGWSPLVLKEFPNAGHYDPIVIFLTMLSLYFCIKRKYLTGIFSLAAATLSKFFSGILLPLWIKRINGQMVLIFLFCIGIFYLPFFIWDETGFKGVFQGLSTYNEQWAYNASIFAVIYTILDKLNPDWTISLIPAKIVAGTLYLTIFLLIYKREEKTDLDFLHKCFWAIGLLFIINPVGDPWYLCWVVPFLCFFPYRSWLILTGLIVLSYLNFHSDIHFMTIRWFNVPILNYIIYVPFFLYLSFEWLYKPDYLFKSTQEVIKK